MIGGDDVAVGRRDEPGHFQHAGARSLHVRLDEIRKLLSGQAGDPQAADRQRRDRVTGIASARHVVGHILQDRRWCKAIVIPFGAPLVHVDRVPQNGQRATALAASVPAVPEP